MGFPKDFIWGAASASYQIEGAVKGKGKGAHIWDVYTGEPGHVFEGHTGEPACDHYHRYREDVKLDLSIFNDVADVIRSCEKISFILFLMFITSKVIRW